MTEQTALMHLSEAVQIPTVSCDDPACFDTAPFLRFHHWLNNTYPNIHKVMTREVVDGFALLYRWPGKDPEKLPILLLAHMDVVPAGSEEAWRFPPFSGEVADGCIYGRGTLDMKGQLIAICEACESLIAQGFVPEQDVYLSFGYDEELMRESSAAKTLRLCQSRGLRFAMVLDEGICADLSPLGVKEPIAALCVAEKGYLDLQLTAQGEAGHASAPPNVTALGLLAEGICAIQAAPLPPKVDREGPLGAFFAALLPLLPKPLTDEQLVEALSGNVKLNTLLRTTMAPTMAKGSEMSNVLPREASAIFNVRLAPWDDLKSVLAHVKALAPQLTAEPLLYTPPAPAADLTGPAYRAVYAAAERALTGAPVLPYIMTAATDSRYFTPVCENILRITPYPHADAAWMHGVDERLPVEDFQNAIAFFKLLLQSTFQ